MIVDNLLVFAAERRAASVWPSFGCVHCCERSSYTLVDKLLVLAAEQRAASVWPSPAYVHCCERSSYKCLLTICLCLQLSGELHLSGQALPTYIAASAAVKNAC